MKKIFALLTASLSVAACIYPYDPELEEAPEGVLAVDGNICIGGTSTVYLSSLLSLWNVDSGNRWMDVSSARVWVEDDAGNKYEGKPHSSLFTIPTENVPQDRSYRLCIEALGETYATDWHGTVEPPVIGDIEFLADDNEVTVEVSVDGGKDGTGYLLLTYEEAWLFHVDYFPCYTIRGTNITEGPIDMSKYWCWYKTTTNRTTPVDYTDRTESGITNFPLMSFSRRSNRNHRRYCISVMASSISKETYRFLRELDENTDGGDNLFTPNPGEIAGNLRCESNPDKSVLGYALFSRAVKKRAYLDSRYHIPIPKTPLVYPLPDGFQYKLLLEVGCLPLEENEKGYDPKQEGPYGWGDRFCYDCTWGGGTLEKPDYWSETE